jgi:hypothetical protein
MSELKMQVAPADLYLSIRGIQYAFHEAVADLVDNSIDANASSVWITTDKKQIVVADDGNGMDAAALEEAITPWRAGKKDAKVRRGQRGKFGIGLKSASYSLGDCLEIHTQTEDEMFEHIKLDRDEISKIKDPNHIFKTKNAVTDIFKSYCKHGHGTVLQITKVNTRKVTSTAIDSLRNLLGLVYFSLIENGELKIMINNEAVKAIDPLMRELKKNSPKNFFRSLGKDTIHVEYQGRDITFRLQAVYTGRGSHWLPEDQKKYRYFMKRDPSENDIYRQGILKLDDQGIYTLRNGRLITLGGWQGLASSNSLLHHNTSTRVLLEFDESGDELMGLDNTKTILKPEESLKSAIGSFIREIVALGEKLFREEGLVLKDKRARQEASKNVKSMNLRKDSAKAAFQMDQRRAAANPEYDKKQKEIEKEQSQGASQSEEFVEFKDKLPYNNLWSFEKNKEGEVLLLLNEQHPGYPALFLEDDDVLLRKNITHFLYTIAMHEASLADLHNELKQKEIEEVERLFKTFRRWVSKHFTEV